MNWYVESCRTETKYMHVRTSVPSSNILDLILTTHPCLFDPVAFITGLSDHEVLFAGFAVSPSYKVITRKEIRLYDRVNFDAINFELRCFADSYFLNFELRNVDEN